jgi:hypothetical protein
LRRQLLPVRCICTWMDIGGFRAKLEGANWDLAVAQSHGLIETLNQAYQIAATPIPLAAISTPQERLLVLNDGIARTIDLPSFGGEPVRAAFYLRDVLVKHFHLLPHLVSRGLGLRTVLSAGERIQYAAEKITGNSFLLAGDHVSEHGKRFSQEEFLYYPAAFQMNTAFSRAYLIEKGKLGRNAIYFDGAFINALSEAMPGAIHMEGTALEVSRDGKRLIAFMLKAPQIFSELKTYVYHVTKFIVGEALDGDEVEFPLA